MIFNGLTKFCLMICLDKITDIGSIVEKLNELLMKY